MDGHSRLAALLGQLGQCDPSLTLQAGILQLRGGLRQLLLRFAPQTAGFAGHTSQILQTTVSGVGALRVFNFGQPVVVHRRQGGLDGLHQFDAQAIRQSQHVRPTARDHAVPHRQQPGTYLLGVALQGVQAVGGVDGDVGLVALCGIQVAPHGLQLRDIAGIVQHAQYQASHQTLRRGR